MSAMPTTTVLGAAPVHANSFPRRRGVGVARKAMSLRAASTGTNVRAKTTTRANAKVVISQTKSGEIRYSFGTPPDPRPQQRFVVSEGSPGAEACNTIETRRYCVLECDGGMAVTGLVLARGADDLLTVASVYPGGTADGMLQPGDVITACSVVVMLENDDGDFVPDFRWHDATEATAEHTLGILMTHEFELRLRVCRNYQPKIDKAVRTAWRTLVPTTTARGVRETWSRLLWRQQNTGRKKNKAASAADEKIDTSIGGIWSGLFKAGSGRDVRGDARKCWSTVIAGGSGVLVTEKKTEKLKKMLAEPATPKPAREVVCVLAEAEVEEQVTVEVTEEAEANVDENDEAFVETVGETKEMGEEDVEEEEEEAVAVAVAEESFAEEEEEEEVTDSTPTWTELEVTLDCTAGVNMTGLQFAQREDGLLRVSACKPGGTACKKVKLNDVLLATTYVVMVPDPSGKRRGGLPTLEWMDAARQGNSFNTLQEAMLTHSQEMKLKLARGTVPLGFFSSVARNAPSAENLRDSAEKRHAEATRATEMARQSMRAAASAGSAVPEDIKAWAAKIAAEARASRK